MFTKTKIAIVLCGSLIAGVAGAQGIKDSDRAAKIEQRKAQHEAKKKEMLAKFDSNKDGKLDDNERAAARDLRMTEMFKKLDTDGNGQISLAEFKSGKLMKQGRHGRMHHRGHGRGLGQGTK